MSEKGYRSFFFLLYYVKWAQENLRFRKFFVIFAASRPVLGNTKNVEGSKVAEAIV